MKILITHNILWSKYKAVVFSELNEIALRSGVEIEFIQIAETEADRVGLGSVDLSFHRYPYCLIWSGSYSDAPKLIIIKRLFFSIWNSDCDLVVIAGYHRVEYWAMLLAARIRKKKVGVFCDSTKFDRSHSVVKSIFKRIFFNFCHAFFAYGNRSREYLISLGAPVDRVYIRCQAAALPVGYNPEILISERMRFSANVARFLYVGRLSSEKRIDDLINAFGRIVRKFEAAQLVIVGDGSQKAALQDLVRSLGIEHDVVFAGALDLDRLSDQYLRATCLVLPSSSEPWGLVVNEALSFGCPVVVSDRCGCVPELVIDGVTGYVYPCGNINSLAACMVNVIHYLGKSASVSSDCIKLISNFSPSNAANQIFSGCLSTLQKNDEY